jgi:hypothetical protein
MANPKVAAFQSDPVEPPAPGPAATPVASDLVQELKVTGHLMALPAGLFCIVNEPSAAGIKNGGFPGIRISPPPNGSSDVEIAGFRADGWLKANGDAALVRVIKGPAQILVTIYQLPNEPDSAPKLQVRQLIGAVEAPAGQAGPQAVPPVGTTEKADVLAHIQSRGDVGVKFGNWLGERGSKNWIEGFAIALPDGFDAADLSYQAVLGRGWLSPWVEAGQYCGSRGMALPLLGFRVRLQGAAAEDYDVICSATFIDGTSAGPVGNDETCEGENLAPLEALEITLIPRVRKPGKAKR